MRTPPHTVSVDTHYSTSASTTANDAHATSYSVRRHSQPLRHLQPTRAHRPTSANIHNITASNSHHFQSLPAPATATVLCPLRLTCVHAQHTAHLHAHQEPFGKWLMQYHLFLIRHSFRESCH